MQIRSRRIHAELHSQGRTIPARSVLDGTTEIILGHDLHDAVEQDPQLLGSRKVHGHGR
jgi:hypothetical protein